jgi:hypothetical protein
MNRRTQKAMVITLAILSVVALLATAVLPFLRVITNQ